MGGWEEYDPLIKFSEGILSLTSKLEVILFLGDACWILGTDSMESVSSPVLLGPSLIQRAVASEYFPIYF